MCFFLCVDEEDELEWDDILLACPASTVGIWLASDRVSQPQQDGGKLYRIVFFKGFFKGCVSMTVYDILKI